MERPAMKASPTTFAALTGLSLIALSTVYAAVFAQNLNVVPPAFGAPAPQAAAPSPGCRDEQGLTYLCSLVVPEDILNLGSTGLLLASGHRAPGHMYLIDPATRTQSELRSEEHTSELQSLRHLVCRLLLEKKKMMY